jgi:hypothetical protein
METSYCLYPLKLSRCVFATLFVRGSSYKECRDRILLGLGLGPGLNKYKVLRSISQVLGQT